MRSPSSTIATVQPSKSSTISTLVCPKASLPPPTPPYRRLPADLFAPSDQQTVLSPATQPHKDPSMRSKVQINGSNQRYKNWHHRNFRGPASGLAIRRR